MATLTRAPRRAGPSGTPDASPLDAGAGAAGAVERGTPGAPAAAAAGDALRPLKRDMPLVPADTIAGRALVTVIAIMTFLAALTAGVALLVAGAANDWQADVGREMTIQVRPTPGGDLDALSGQAVAIAKATPGVASVDPYSKAEGEKLLQPWLGGDLGDLPVPRLVVVKLDPGHALDVPALRLALAERVPGAILDDHGVWLGRFASMAHATVGVGVLVFALVLSAMLLAVAFATRGAMAGAREIIEVLHFVGAADGFISRQFQTHFLRLGLRGGVIGGGAATLFFLGVGRALGHWRTSAGGEQIEAMFGSFGLGLGGYVAIGAITVAVALLTGFVSRAIVYKHLRRMM